jgi:hypothetical protein
VGKAGSLVMVLISVSSTAGKLSTVDDNVDDDVDADTSKGSRPH